MFILPKKQMGLGETLRALFSSWISLIVILLPLSLLCEGLKIIPAVMVSLDWVSVYQKSLVLALLIGFSILSVIPMGALIAKVNDTIHGKTMSNKTALQIGFTRLLKVIFVGIIFYIVMFLLGKLGSLLVPHIGNTATLSIISVVIVLLSPYVISTLPLIIIDNKWPFDAIASSIRQTKGHWIPCLVVMLASILVSLVINYLFALLLHVTGFNSGLWVYLGVVATLFTLPLGICMAVIISENLKLSK